MSREVTEGRGHMVSGDMGDLDRTLPGRARQRDKTDVFADESQTLNEIAMQVKIDNVMYLETLKLWRNATFIL